MNFCEKFNDCAKSIWSEPFLAGLTLIFFSSVLYGAPESGISMSLTPSTVQPGDMIELRAKMLKPDYAEFVFSMPPHESLRRVAFESGVVRFLNGHYEQEHLWVLQAVRSGEVIFDNIKATVISGGHEIIYDQAPLTLQINPYSDIDISNKPAALAELGVDEINNKISWIWVVIAVLSLFFIFKRFPVSKRKKVCAEEEDPFVLVIDQLKEGSIPVVQLEIILAGLDADSVKLRFALEEMLYAQRGSAHELALLLEEEIRV